MYLSVCVFDSVMFVLFVFSFSFFILTHCSFFLSFFNLSVVKKDIIEKRPTRKQIGLKRAVSVDKVYKKAAIPLVSTSDGAVLQRRRRRTTSLSGAKPKDDEDNEKGKE